MLELLELWTGEFIKYLETDFFELGLACDWSHAWEKYMLVSDEIP